MRCLLDTAWLEGSAPQTVQLDESPDKKPAAVWVPGYFSAGQEMELFMVSSPLKSTRAAAPVARCCI
jgi:hypothetical protein